MGNRVAKLKCEYIMTCGDCNEEVLCLTCDEAQNCLNALSFFISKHKTKEPQTCKDMEKLCKKLWKLKCDT
jgi:hypothetical protein